jgi:integrase
MAAPVPGAERPGAGRGLLFRKDLTVSNISAWVFQKAEQVRDLGPDKASWYVGWYEPNGRRRKESFGPGPRGKERAERKRRQLEHELMTGTYQVKVMKTWEEFREQYEKTVLPGLSARTRHEAILSLNHFERITKPVRMIAVTSETIDRFIAARREEPGLCKGDRVSPATVNKDLRHLKAALGRAKKWGYLAQLPDFDFEREIKKLPTYVTPEHFAAIYNACGAARLPKDVPNVNTADWWRAIVVMAYMTGWRISDLLGLRRADLDLNEGIAVTRGADNKGKRDERVRLHPVVVDHLRKLAGFDPHVFPWNHNERTLYAEFVRVQEAAGISLPCHEAHEHTTACTSYGFHDLRRAFATMNADKLSADALQALMRHKSYQTTQVYINLTRQLDAAVQVLHVPEVLRKGVGQ